MLASDLQRKLGVIQGRTKGSPSSAEIVQQPLLICVLAVQTDLHTAKMPETQSLL